MEGSDTRIELIKTAAGIGGATIICFIIVVLYAWRHRNEKKAMHDKSDEEIQ